jgi:hypothetical protein
LISLNNHPIPSSPKFKKKVFVAIGNKHKLKPKNELKLKIIRKIKIYGTPSKTASIKVMPVPMIITVSSQSPSTGKHPKP